MAEKLKSRKQFVQAVIEKFGWNAAIGFWYGFYYKQYVDSLLSFDEAVDKLGVLADYTGAPTT